MKWESLKDKPDEINKLIAENFMGWSEEIMPASILPDYSTNIIYAWEVIDKIISEDKYAQVDIIIEITENWVIIENGVPVEPWKQSEGKRHISVEAGENTAPLAICHAALLYKGVIE